MAFHDFTLELAEQRLGLTTNLGDLFPCLAALEVSDWLKETLERGRSLAALVSEKARSEFLVVPFLLSCRELVAGDLTIYSGQRLDVDAARGLVGECDYILARTAPVPRLRAPLVTVLEAKRGDIELGLGQCVAQMVGAQLFNEQAKSETPAMYGVVTTGENWQFIRLESNIVTLHSTRLFIDNPGLVLAALKAVLLRPKTEQ
jgi:hypothetical protein